MSDPFIGEVRIFTCTFAPVGWAWCLGQQVPVSQYQALYAVIGTIYGGNGNPYFNLPNLQGQVLMGAGQGPGLSNRILKTQLGAASVTLNNTTTPPHNHGLQAQNLAGNALLPAAGAYLANDAQAGGNIFTTAPSSAVNDSNTVQMAANAIGGVGGNAVGAANPHENCQPWLGFNFCIALDGEFPVRN